MEEKLEGRNFLFYGTVAAVYAVVHVLCLWKNHDGVLVPVWSMALLAYLAACMNRFGWKLKKSALFYGAAVVLIGISTFLTRDSSILFMNYLFMVACAAMIVIRQMCDDREFGIIKYMGSMLTVIAAPVGYIIQPFIEFAAYRKNVKNRMDSTVKGVIIGFVISVPLLAVIVSLLSGADMVFSSMLLRIDWFKPQVILQDGIGKIGCMFVVFLLAYGAGYFYEQRMISNTVSLRKKWEPVSGITVSVILAAVYLFFCGIQIVYLFGGGRNLPEGYSYAEYAREGYFQLFFVCVINLVLLVCCRTFYRADLFLKVLLALISGCTFVMIASSLYRMVLYVQYYGLSTLRVLVFWSLAVLVIWMAGVFLYIWKEGFPLFRYAFVSLVCMYLVLAFGKKDYWVSWYNLNVAVSGEETDIAYLTTLSEDAAPVLCDYYFANREMLQEEKGLNRDEDSFSDYQDLEYYFKGIQAGKTRGIFQYNASAKKAEEAAGRVLEDMGKVSSAR